MPEKPTFTFPCPHCSQNLEAEESMAGAEIACPQCQNTIQIPQSDNPRPAPRAIDIAPNPEQRALYIITTTGNEVGGHRIEKYLGIARGIVVRSPTSTESLFGGLKQIVGGNIETYAKICDQARQEAFSRMIQHANKMNADAVIAFRYDATEFAAGITEVLAYGTAVKLAAIE